MEKQPIRIIDQTPPPERAIVQATRHFDNPDVVAKVSRGLGEAMVGINVADIPVHHRLEDRGW